MRKHLVKMYAGLLAIVMLLSGCSIRSQGILKDDETVAKNPVDTYETHYVENTLHKVNVTDSERPFVVNGKSEYKVIVGDDDASKEAAKYLIKHVNFATGCSLSYADVEEYTADGKYIVLNVPKLFTEAGLTMPKDDLGVMGYYVKSVGDNVFLTSNYDEGARFVILAFLRHVIGIEIYASDCIKYTKDGTTLPDMDIVEKPDVTYFMEDNYIPGNADEMYLMGFAGDRFAYVGGRSHHNTLLYLPKETYMENHPKWYSTHGNDLCFTAHGDDVELNLMADKVAEIMLETLNNDPDAYYITCSTNDIATACECETCKITAIKYNGANSAAVIKFNNMVSERVQADLQRQADAMGTKKRNVKILFFAYNAYTLAPVIKNEDGTFSPIDETVICAENVGVYYAPIQANFTDSFWQESNQTFYDISRGWAACASEIYYWLYETNFMYYLYPYNNWGSLMETLRFCGQNNAAMIKSQAQWDQYCSTGFASLKTYINSRAAFDLNSDYDKILNDFFANYFGAAEEPMRQYFDELQAWMEQLEEKYPTAFNGSIYSDMGKEEYWPANLLNRWMELIDEAYEAVGSDQALINHIKAESIFLRYALIQHHAGKYTADELKEMQISFKNDCETLGIRRVKEKTDIATVFDAWGITN